ncbi:MAG TPA: sugar ABC transporter [Planctomycetaceae bacterium]|nr:sugar ABC transporter [Planctomycetaceae bacterium]
MNTPLLQMKNISKRFGATQALEGVSLDAHAGQVLALIGENGAGKSTLMKVLGGAHAPDEGSIELSGIPLSASSPHEAREAGVAIVYQELNLAPDLSIEDNIMLGIEQSRCGIVDRALQRTRIQEALDLLGQGDLDVRKRVGELSVGLQQLVEIARALISDARVIVFDEPTSSLESRDVQRLFTAIKRLQERGIAIIYISHFLEEIREIASEYAVLRDGKLVATGELAGSTDQDIVKLMVGRDVDTLFPKVEHDIGEAILSVRQLSGHSSPVEVDFDLHRGEVFGLFGLIGAGRTETLRLLFGLDSCSGGSAELHGSSRSGSPHRRIAAGLGLVSEDRKGEGLAQQLSIEDNLTLSHLKPYSNFGLLNLRRRRVASTDWMQRMEVKARSPQQPISALSGGNQQKVAIARVLHQGASVLLLDEPTRGIDVATKSAIYRLIGQQASAGKSIIFVSSYLPELMAVCDTLGVMASGRLVETRPVSKWTETEVLQVAIGG